MNTIDNSNLEELEESNLDNLEIDIAIELDNYNLDDNSNLDISNLDISNSM